MENQRSRSQWWNMWWKLKIQYDILHGGGMLSTECPSSLFCFPFTFIWIISAFKILVQRRKCLSVKKISSKSTGQFLCKVANKQTNKQTDMIPLRDCFQNLINLSLGKCLSVKKISSKSTGKFLCKVVHKQINTRTGVKTYPPKIFDLRRQ